MKEEVIQQFWNAKFAIQKVLKTTNNQSIFIQDFGELNVAQGPDFTGAVIEIDGVIHSGAVEIHVDSKNWEEHAHQFDEKYANVILHVVWNYSNDIYDFTGRIIPTLALNQFFSLKDLQKVQIHLLRNSEFPCNHFHQDVLVSDKYQQLVFAQSKRWERKVDEILLKHYEFKGNWHQVVFYQFAKYWMNAQNRESMLLLINDVDIFRLQKFSEAEMLAFWLGQSGMRVDHLFETQISKRLWTNFLFLKHKFQLKEFKLHWYFGKIRPKAFPDVRLWQWSQWLSKHHSDFAQWLLVHDYQTLLEKLTIEIDYFNQNTKKYERVSNGDQHIQQLLINVIVPIWMAYATYHGDNKLLEHAMNILELLPAESNSITRKMEWLNIFNGSAKHSQQLMGQYQNFCQKRKCLDCLIGQSYVNTSISG